MSQEQKSIGNGQREIILQRNQLRITCTLGQSGRILQKTESYGGKSLSFAYSYDADGHLTCVTKDDWEERERYQYNDLGQRTVQFSGGRPMKRAFAQRLSYDDKGRLHSDGLRSFQYNDHGAMSHIYDHRGETRLCYGNDTLLDKVYLPDGSFLRYEYLHIYPVRRYRYSVLSESYEWNTESTRLTVFRDHDVELNYHFTYADDGTLDTIRIERMAEKDKQTWPRNTKWHEVSRDWRSALTDGNRQKKLYELFDNFHAPVILYCGCDQVGTLRVLFDSQGTLIKEIERDSFGRLIQSTLPELYLPLGLAGGLEDRTTGLVRFGWRDYDPVTGRFTAPDPARDMRGDGDLYDYCADDPVNHRDPDGLWSKKTFAEGRVSRDERGRFGSGASSTGPEYRAPATRSYVLVAQPKERAVTPPAPTPQPDHDSTAESTQDISPEDGEKILATAEGWATTPYVSGGREKLKGADCSGSLTGILKEANVPYEHASSTSFDKTVQKGYTRYLEKGEEPMPGDVVLWGPSDKGVGHVGIYAGPDPRGGTNYEVYSATTRKGFTKHLVSIIEGKKVKALLRLQKKEKK